MSERKRYAKIVFLDMDGVVNHHPLDECKVLPGEENCGTFHDPVCVQHIVRLLVAADAGFVLTSTWRFNPTIIYQLHGVGLPTDRFLGSTTRRHMDRGDQILDWFKSHPVLGNDVRQYVIIDDEMHDIQQPQHEGRKVQTSMDHGITELDVIDAYEILNKED